MNIRFSFNPDQNTLSLARRIRPFLVTAALAASVAPPYVSAQVADRSSAVTAAAQPYQAASGQAYGDLAPEGSYPEQAAPGSGRTRAEVRTETARWIAAGRPGANEYDPTAFVSTAGGRSLTRAEVATDTGHWQRAELSTATQGEASPDVHDRDFQSRREAYRALHDGPVHAHEALRPGRG